MKVAITGSNGQLGQCLLCCSRETPQLTVVPLTRSDVDFNDPVGVHKFFSGLEVDVVINAAAYTAVDEAESEPERADLINHQSVAALGRVLAERQIPLIHVSTDYVYSGHGHRPWRPDDPAEPVNQYGLSKLRGEHALQSCGVTGLIIRTSWLFSPFGKNFVTTLVSLAQKSSSLKVITDQIGSPTSALDVARFMLNLLMSKDHRLVQPIAVTHFVNAGVASWYDLACAITSKVAPTCNVQAITSEQWPAVAQRPFYSVLDATESPKPRWWQFALQETLIYVADNQSIQDHRNLVTQ